MADIDVWVVRLDGAGDWPAPTPAEAARAAKLKVAPLRQRYLRSHAALRSILRRYTAAPLNFSVGEHGKPELAAVPELQFNLSHSHELALIAVARGIAVGVDVEWFRPLAECQAIAERFFPPEEAARLAEVRAESREAEFFRRWTRIEAVLKARGIGLYGAGTEAEGDWTVLPVEVGAEYTASVAGNRGGLTAAAREFRGAE